MKPTEQQIRSATVSTGDLFDVLDRVSRKASAKAYGTTSPQVMAVRDATLAMCDGMKAELRERVIQEFARAYGEAPPRESAYTKYVSHGCTEHDMQFGTCRNCGHTEHGWGQSG